MGVLGDVAPRPALAHPRAIAVTDDGDSDDTDEVLFVTEFFSQQLLGDEPTSFFEFDVSRQGMVYRVTLGSTPTVETIAIAPVNDTGFKDYNGCTTGCFPNQLHAAELHGDCLMGGLPMPFGTSLFVIGTQPSL